MENINLAVTSETKIKWSRTNDIDNNVSAKKL